MQKRVLPQPRSWAQVAMQPGLEVIWLGGGVTASLHLTPGALRALVAGVAVYWLGSQLWSTDSGFAFSLPSWLDGGSGAVVFPWSGVEFGFSFFGAVVTVASLLATGALVSSGFHF